MVDLAGAVATLVKADRFLVTGEVTATEVTDLFNNEALVHAMWVLRDQLERLQ